MPIEHKQPVYVRTNFPTFHTTPESPFIWEPSKLHVICPITNPHRYSSRYHLFEHFEKMVLDAGAQLWVIEAAFGNRPHVITTKSNDHHIQLRTWHELWHKENLINLAIARLPSDWEYCSWIDGDISFARHDWVNETLNQLQHYQLVQMFSHTHDLDPHGTITLEHPGFAFCYNQEPENFTKPADMTLTGYYGPTKTQKKPYYAHPGYAWAARRSAIDHLGGLIDTAILGSADFYMAYSLIGQVEPILKGFHPQHKSEIMEWQARAEKHIMRNIGYVSGSLLHHWHGKKKDRKYNNRYKILLQHGFNPAVDLKRDGSGLWQLTDRNYLLRDDIRKYFISRCEDSTDVE